jgi:signal transduction histidine kinase
MPTQKTSERKRIFEPFFYNKDKSESRIGLSVVYGIIKHRNGLLTCKTNR